jgi:hypothetical protein
MYHARERDDKFVQSFVGNMEGSDRLEDLGANGRIVRAELLYN